ncbi:MAG: pentapeptide repeat-containing protein [Methylophilaceae bacterium]|nr:pentapeptide repeat-containing protein [Methylophilaceae bacterium]
MATEADDIHMNAYRTWLIRRGELVKGPFPEPLVCQYILLGRIRDSDLLSTDGHAWSSYTAIPEIMAHLHSMLVVPLSDGTDPSWQEERRQALLRHLDERKCPDRRESQHVELDARWREQRRGEERRKNPESESQRLHRQILHEVDRSLKKERTPSLVVLMLWIAGLFLVGWLLYHFQHPTPIRVELRFASQADCDAAPAKGVDWHGCDKSGYLLVGADLRGANLTNANLYGANLSYAQLEGADLSGAIWTDGRQCAPGSVGRCK